jgi:hypothetical protein
MEADTPMPPRGSTAHAPDLAWSQVRETVLMLELATGQIGSAMTDSNTSVDVLTSSFTTMAEQMRVIGDGLDTLPELAGHRDLQQTLQGATDHVSGLMHQAIIAFQFYDRLVQRLSHVCHSLGELSELVRDQARIYNPQQWVQLQQQLVAKYSMPEERAMFDAVMSGVPVHEVLQRYAAGIKNQEGNDVELF